MAEVNTPIATPTGILAHDGTGPGRITPAQARTLLNFTVPDGDKGDVTVSGGGATWAIDNDAVTLAKLANAAASSKLLGSGATGAGADYAELTLGTNLSMSGTTLNATASAVTSSINGHIETVAIKSYVLELKAPTGYTINSLTTDCASGSCTVAVQIDGTPVTWTGSVTTLGASTTETEVNALSANTVAIGATVALVVSANTSCLDLWFTVKVT